ncbi:hypothetical protein HDU76_009513 [Blyttiomyces sp. JEL0837]|nr:hypothetical protein HDU76_009513 [Blyttiomyces sp. JEL0837]
MFFTAASLIALVVSAIAQPVVKNLDKDIVADLSLYAKKDATPFSVSTLLAVVTDPSQKAVLDLLAGAKGDITLFAPTDAAFANLNKAVNTSDAGLITQVLQYHASAGAPFIPTSNGRYFVDSLLTSDLIGGAEPVVADVSDKGVVLSFGLLQGSGFTANVVQTDVILGGKGVIHFVDQVLIPPQKASATAIAAKLDQLVKAVVATKLVDTIDTAKKITILAPTDDAFNAISTVAAQLTPAQLTSILTFHVIPGVFRSTDLFKAGNVPKVPTLFGNNTLAETNDGKTISIAGAGNKTPAKVVLPDVLIANGVVHVIDTVLLPDLATLGPIGQTTTSTYTPKPTTTNVLYSAGERVAPASFAVAAVAALAAMAF